MYKKLLLKVMLLSVPIVLLTGLVNYFVDGAFVFKDRSSEIASILVSGNNAAIKYVPSNWGDLQTAVVAEKIKRGRLTPNDIMVFGTSRSSEINSGLFHGGAMFNCVIPGGNLLDYIGLYGLYKSSNLLPKYLIISIDPWTFHERVSVTINNKRHSVADPNIPLTVNPDLSKNLVQGMRFLDLENISNPAVNKESNKIGLIKELFSPSYLQSNIEIGLGKVVFITNNNFESDYFVIRSDGGYSQSKETQIDSIKVKKKSMDFLEIHRGNFFLKGDTSSLYFNYFQKLLLAIKKDQVTPVVYFSPINPLVYDGLVQDTIVPIEYAISSFCSTEGILYIGSFNPHKYGYHNTGTNFSDSYHPVRSVVNSIFYKHEAELKKIGIALTSNSN